MARRLQRLDPAQVGVFNASPILNGEGAYASAGGIWMGAGGPVADSSGNVYVTTGNGPWNGTNAWADSVLKFPPTPTAGANGCMQPSDYFTPSIYQYMDCDDADLAAGGFMLIPGTHQLIAGGKTGTMSWSTAPTWARNPPTTLAPTQEQVWGAGLADGNTYPTTCTDSTGTNTRQHHFLRNLRNLRLLQQLRLPRRHAHLQHGAGRRPPI